MIDPIYRKLVHMVDTIEEGDQFLRYDTNEWCAATSLIIGNIFNRYKYYKCRRLDIRTMTIKEILNSND